MLGGALLIAVALGTCASIVGRNVFGTTVVGDFELTGAASGVAIALCLPWCQWSRGSIVIDFFTTGAAPRTLEWLDRCGAGLVAIVMAMLAWRTGFGGVNAYQNHAASMLLALPDWIVHAAMVVPMLLSAAIALHQALGPRHPSSPGAF